MAADTDGCFSTDHQKIAIRPVSYTHLVQKTIIDRCVRLVYQTYLNDPRPENMPILEDLYNLLRSQEEKL